MTDKQDLIREIHEYVTTHGGENTATHLLVQAASAIQTQAAELEAVGAGGVQALSAAPAGWRLVPVNPTPEMWKAAKSVPDPNPPYPPHYGLVWDAMLAASPTPQSLSAAPVEVADAMADSQYLAGVSAGWNAANADNPNEALRKLHESRAGYLKPLDAARKQGGA